MPRRRLPFLLSCVLFTACDGVPLHWAPAAPAVGEATLHVAPPEGGVELLSHVAGPGAACVGSLRGAASGDSVLVVAWWAVRADSSATLVATRGTAVRDPDAKATRMRWDRALAIDTLDRGTRGCARPAPAIAFEPRTGYVRVSYAMDAPEGTGVFFAHSMDGGRMWHAPVSIVYGPRLAATAIAARGDTVAVAYEDPNSAEPPQVALALSITAGHIFEHKSIPVSAGAYAATSPEVALEPSGVVVGWRERRPDGEVPMRRRAAWSR